MQIAAVLFDRLTALDVIGPYEVLQRLPDAVVTFVGHRKGEVRTENGFLGLTVDATFDEVPRPDVIVVPGGIGTRALLDDEPLLSLAPPGPRDDPVHDVGVHGLAACSARRACSRG